MKKIINISGMHCISCEILLEKELKKIKGVELVVLSHKKGIMEVNCETEDDYNKVVKAIEKNNFKVLVEGENNNDNNYLLNVIIILFVVILLMFNQLFDLYKYIPDTSTLSYSSAFLVGLIASISTCLAITGGIIIGFSKYIDSAKTNVGHLKVQLGFQVGRLLGFFFLGGLLGFTGQLINISFSFTAILTFVIGILLLYMGLNIMGIFPSLSKFGIHLPKSFASKIEKLGKPKYAPVVGALTFFLPCGFTQTMQLLAISSGSFWGGGLVMFFFALGTFPVLFSVGLGSSYFNDKKLPILNKVIAAILVFFGIVTIANSSNLLSFYTSGSNNNNVHQNGEIEVINNDSIEIIKVGHNGWNTEPREIVLEKGKNYKLIITPEKNGIGCMSTQLIPRIKSKVSYIRAGEEIIYDFNNTMVGKYDIVCASMGMLQGTIIIK